MRCTISLFTAFFMATATSQILNIPPITGKITLNAPQSISGIVDLGNKEYDRGVSCSSDADSGSKNAVFILEAGATLKNVIIGAKQLEGIHCKGACKLINIWFRDVCEDAITLLGPGNVLIEGGGAANAGDKVCETRSAQLICH